MFASQRTLVRPCRFEGVGIHSGSWNTVEIAPAPVDHGIVFREAQRGKPMRATVDQVVSTRNSTALVQGKLRVNTVEHLLSALQGLGIDNALIIIRGQEIPILDGSAAPFCQAIMQGGITLQPASRNFLRILEPIEVQSTTYHVGLYPSEERRFDMTVDFPQQHIGKQRLDLTLTPEAFLTEVAAARTFGFVQDLQTYRQHGLARGAGPENVLALDPQGRPLPGFAPRWKNEIVRHKLLDAIGDLSLAGGPIWGTYRGHKSGHTAHLELLQKLFACPERWTWVHHPFALAQGNALQPPAYA